MSEFEKKLLETKSFDGVTYEIYRYEQRRRVLRTFEVPLALGATTPTLHPYIDDVVVYQVCAKLENASVILEPGALQYYKGKIKADVLKHEPGKSWISRKIASAGTGESAYGVRYTGTGEIWMEPASKHFIIADVDPDMPMLLDDKAFYSCTGKVSVSTKRHTTVAGVMSGNELVQPKLSGCGVAVLESPVSESELVFIEMDGTESLVVDGDYMLFYSETLDLKIGPLVSGLLNIKRSGEGLVFTMTGKGMVCLMPTSKIAG